MKRCMLLHAAVATILAGLSAASLKAGAYRDLVDEFHRTGPIAYARENAARQPAPAIHGTAPAAAAEPAARQLMVMRERWLKRLALPPSVTPAPTEDQAEVVVPTGAALDARLAQPVSLDVLLDLVPARNPAVHAARENLRATLEQYPQATFLDGILKQYNAFTKQLNTRIGPPRHKDMQAMNFPFPDALALKGGIVSEEVEIAQQREQIALRDARTTMATAFHQFAYLDAAIAIERENQGLLEQMIRVAQEKIRAGKSRYNAVIMAQVELAKLSDSILTLEERRQTIIARINTLLDRSPTAALGAPLPLPDEGVAEDLDALYARAVRDRQELRQQRFRISRTRTMIELAARMAYPDPSTGASYFEHRMRLIAGSDQTAPAFPRQRTLNQRQTPWFGQRDAYIREIETRLDAMDRTLTGMENETRFKVRRAWFALDTAERSLALYRRSLLPQAQQAMDATATGYVSGNTDFLVFLDTQRTLLKFRLAEARARQDARVQLAQLEQVCGQPLPRRPSAADETNANERGQERNKR